MVCVRRDVLKSGSYENLIASSQCSATHAAFGSYAGGGDAPDYASGDAHARPWHGHAHKPAYVQTCKNTYCNGLKLRQQLKRNPEVGVVSSDDPIFALTTRVTRTPLFEDP